MQHGERNARQSIADARRVVVKMGTTALGTPHLDVDCVRQVAAVVADLMTAGRSVVLVSSGAVAAGSGLRGLSPRGAAASEYQTDARARAAVGQARLMAMYSSAFDEQGLDCAQVLLTDWDVGGGVCGEHLSALLDRLLRYGIVPVLNENDVTSTQTHPTLAAQSALRDNDALAALVARAVSADALVFGCSVEGVLREGTVIPFLDPETWERQDIFEEPSCAGRGGMASKLRAAADACQAGVWTGAALGPGGVRALLRGEGAVGTVFGVAAFHEDPPDNGGDRSASSYTGRA